MCIDIKFFLRYTVWGNIEHFMKFLYIFLFFSRLAISTPINNPALCVYIQEGLFLPGKYSLSARVGYEGNFISDARLEQKGVHSARVDNYHLSSNSATAVFNVKNRVDLFAILGASRISANWRISPPFGGIFRIALQTRYDFNWSLGSRVVLWKNEKSALGITGRYFFTKADISWLTSNGVPQLVRGGKIDYKEWQVDLGISHKIGFLVPYCGIKYSNAVSDIFQLPSPVVISSGGTNTLQMQRKDHIGGFLGVTLTDGKKILISIEARLADEEAATILGQFRF